LQLALKALLESEDGGVDGVFKLGVVTEALLEEGLGILHVFADGAGLPGEIGARRVDLVQLRSVAVKASDHEGDAEGADAAGLGELLHDGGLLANELGNRGMLAILEEVGLRLLAGLAGEHPGIRAKPRVRNADAGADGGCLAHGGTVHQYGRQLLL